MQHNYIDRFAALDSPIHRLDARSKILSVLIYIVTIISVPRTELFTLVPYAVFPALLLVVAGLPLKPLVKHTLIVSPFILSIAVFAPIFDRVPVGQVAGLTITSGWLICGNLVFKFFLTVMTTLILAATTRFDLLLHGMDRLGLPRVMVMQLSFLYRYMFILVEEAFQMRRARDARNFGKASLRHRWQAVRGILAVLFIKTLDRAERVYAAMVARGFSGHIPSLQVSRFRARDWAFLASVIVFVTVVRLAQ